MVDYLKTVDSDAGPIETTPVQIIQPDGSVQSLGRTTAALSSPTTEAVASAGATVSVASSASAVTLKAANSARMGLTIANDSTAILYVLLGTGTVSTSLYTFALAAKGTVASDRTIGGFTGTVTGIWASANGSALVTELT